MEGTVFEINERHLVAAEMPGGFAVFQQMGPHFKVGDSVSWTEGMHDGYVVNKTSKKQHRVFFQCRSTPPGTLYVHMRGQV